MSRAIMAPHYGPVTAYTGDGSGAIIASHHQQQVLQQHPFLSNPPYTTAATNGPIPAFANQHIAQPRPLPPLMQAEIIQERPSVYRYERQGFVERDQSISPHTKPETQLSVMKPQKTNYKKPQGKVIPPLTTSPGEEVNFGTEVDTLMKAIQAKAQTAESPQVAVSPVPSKTVDLQNDENSSKGCKKNYKCKIAGCPKSFYQKTHLDIHERAHTGDKPYPCKEPGCGRSFSQLGNLKTHERRHTGERPYKCDICDKKFAQRGNVRAHRIVHEQAKPFVCLLDNCSKQFTQLGNLKSHQNKFHAVTIRELTLKFASMKYEDVAPEERELFHYFAELYKNSNKGIKGRGKDRKVGLNNAPRYTNARSLGPPPSSGGYSLSGPGRGHILMTPMPIPRRGSTHYEMYDADDGSQSSRHSASPVYGSPSFEDHHHHHGRSVDMPYVDRIY